MKSSRRSQLHRRSRTKEISPGVVRAQQPAARPATPPSCGDPVFQCANIAWHCARRLRHSKRGMSEVKHYGVFQFKNGITEEQIENCFAEMKGMVGKIPGLLEMINGPYESSEGM